MTDRSGHPAVIQCTGRSAGLVISVVLLISAGCSVLKQKPGGSPRRVGESDPSGVRMTIYASPEEFSGVEFTIFNPDAEVRIERQQPGWHRVLMEVYVQEDDAGALLLHGLEIEVLSEAGDLKHVRLRGWIPEEALLLPSTPVQEQDIRLEVIEWAWQSVTGGVFIHGVVRNEGEVQAHDAQITVSATDEQGQQLIPRTVRLRPGSVNPGETAHFEVRLDATSEPYRIFARFRLSAKP